MIDMNSIRFCTNEELSQLAGEPWIQDMELGEGTVNLKLFRTAVEYRLGNMTGVNHDLRILVRQLEPTAEGLPLQLYFFTEDKNWVPHEHLAADIMEYIIASMPQFGLRVFQKPSGLDFHKI